MKMRVGCIMNYGGGGDPYLVTKMAVHWPCEVIHLPSKQLHKSDSPLGYTHGICVGYADTKLEKVIYGVPL